MQAAGCRYYRAIHSHLHTPVKRTAWISIALLATTAGLRAELTIEARVMTAGHFANGQKGLVIRASIRNQGPGEQQLHIMKCSWDRSWRLSENNLVPFGSGLVDSNIRRVIYAAEH